MCVGEPKVLELPQRLVKIHEQKTFEVTEFEVTRHYDRYTPVPTLAGRSMRSRWVR